MNEQFLHNLMRQYTTDHLIGIDPETFKKQIDEFLELEDWEMEGYSSPEMQRHESVKFYWGHNHDFGTFELEGKAGDRHIQVLSKFIDMGLPKNLIGKRILDIGVWTGGTTLLLVAMGANVIGLEEVYKYTEAARLLEDFFDFPKTLYRWDGETPQISFNCMSLYDEYVSKVFVDAFDYVICAGVLYHLTDLIVALRIIFNCLKDGGQVFIETACSDEMSNVMQYVGPSKSGWNWIIPSHGALRQMLTDVGFEEVNIEAASSKRVYVIATRKQYKDMLRAGLSRGDIR